MNWIKIDATRYVNQDHVRDIQFIEKNGESFLYRLFFTSGQAIDVKGFGSMADARQHASLVLGVPVEDGVGAVKKAAIKGNGK